MDFARTPKIKRLFVFLLSEAQPKNALVPPKKKIWKQLSALRVCLPTRTIRAHAPAQPVNISKPAVTVLQFSSYFYNFTIFELRSTTGKMFSCFFYRASQIFSRITKLFAKLVRSIIAQSKYTPSFRCICKCQDPILRS
jgi:hypothetical protein